MEKNTNFFSKFMLAKIGEGFAISMALYKRCEKILGFEHFKQTQQNKAEKKIN